MSDLLTKVLEADPVAMMEKSIDKSCEEMDSGDQLDLLQGCMSFFKFKDDVLKASGDTTMYSSWTHYLDICTELGFKVAHVENYDCECVYSITRETEVLMYHPCGLILHLTSFRGNINKANLYGEWIPTDPKDIFEPFHQCSGGIIWKDPEEEGGERINTGVMSFDYDCRDGLKYFLKNLMKYGSTLPIWTDVKAHHLWFLNSAEEKMIGYDFQTYDTQKMSIEKAGKSDDKIFRRILGLSI